VRFACFGRNVLKLLNPLGSTPTIERDLKAYEGELPALAPVKLPGVDG
jgi:hypothetical protein